MGVSSECEKLEMQRSLRNTGTNTRLEREMFKNLRLRANREQVCFQCTSNWSADNIDENDLVQS